MTNEEAKFMLQGYRPNGGDAQDPAFAEALKQVERDPALRAWFEREQAFDRVIVDKLNAVAPPADLRDSILAGSRLSSKSTRQNDQAWWQRPWTYGLMAAAALVVLFSMLGLGPVRSAAGVTSEQLFEVAVADAAGAHPDSKHADMLGGFGAWLESPASHFAAGVLPVSAVQLQTDGCRTIDIAGHEVFEICFSRNGNWYHVYIAPRTNAEALPSVAPVFHQQNELVAMSWSDRQFGYMVSSTTSIEDLRALL